MARNFTYVKDQMFKDMVSYKVFTLGGKPIGSITVRDTIVNYSCESVIANMGSIRAAADDLRTAILEAKRLVKG